MFEFFCYDYLYVRKKGEGKEPLITGSDAYVLYRKPLAKEHGCTCYQLIITLMIHHNQKIQV